MTGPASRGRHLKLRSSAFGVVIAEIYDAPIRTGLALYSAGSTAEYNHIFAYECNMSAIPAVQKAWVNVRRGKPSEAVLFRDDYPVPSKLPPGEVLIKIQAAAYNPVCVFQ